MEKIYKRPETLAAAPTRYCPGCMHGLISKLIAELVEEYGIANRTVAVLPVGCGAMSKNLFTFDVVCAAHGRAPAVATGFSRCAPDKIVFTYQGDGDLGAIGLSEILHAANRGERFLTVFINNSTYGMTGGQMAPTTLIGQKTTTTPLGRDPRTDGYPMRMCEILSQLEAPAYIARFSLRTPAGVLRAKEGLRKALEIQLRGEGFAFVELLSTCPTNWGLSPERCLDWMAEHSEKVFPEGEYRRTKEVR